MAKPDAALVERVSKAKRKASGITKFAPPAGYEAGEPHIKITAETSYYPKSGGMAPSSLSHTVRRIAIAAGREAR